MNGELLEEVECFEYLRSKIAVDGGIEIKVKSRINGVGKVLGGMKVFSCRVMGMNVKRRLYEGVAVPTALYGTETWRMVVAEKKRLNVMEMKCFEEYVWRNAYGPSEKLGGVKERKTGVTRVGWSSRTESRHMKRMKEDQLVKKIVGSDVRCEVERKATKGMDGWCENSVECKRNVWSKEG